MVEPIGGAPTGSEPEAPKMPARGRSKIPGTHDRQHLEDARHYMQAIVEDIRHLLAGKERGKAGLIGRDLQRNIESLKHVLAQLHDLPQAQDGYRELLDQTLSLVPGLPEALHDGKLAQWAKAEMHHPAMTPEAFSTRYQTVSEHLARAEERLGSLHSELGIQTDV